jgi:outer membrane receptor for monomeric catechols
VVAGYTYLNPTAVGLAGAGIQGPIPNTAHNQANIWTNYDFPFGLKLGTGSNYISERFAGTDAQQVPGSISTPTVPGPGRTFLLTARLSL